MGAYANKMDLFKDYLLCPFKCEMPLVMHDSLQHAKYLYMDSYKQCAVMYPLHFSLHAHSLQKSNAVSAISIDLPDCLSSPKAAHATH